MFKHILLPIDTSEVSGNAARSAIELARACHAAVTSLFVVLPELTEARYRRMRDPGVQDRAQAIGQRVADIRAAAADAGVAYVDHTVQAGEPWDAILQVSREKGCDLVVMGTHARHGLSHFLLGSETQAVLARSKVPVLVFPPSRAPLC